MVITPSRAQYLNRAQKYSGKLPEIAFDQFYQRADQLVLARVGLGIDDFCDADWYALYDDTMGEATEEEIFELLAEADEIFAQMIEL